MCAGLDSDSCMFLPCGSEGETAISLLVKGVMKKVLEKCVKLGC